MVMRRGVAGVFFTSGRLERAALNHPLSQKYVLSRTIQGDSLLSADLAWQNFPFPSPRTA